MAYPHTHNAGDTVEVLAHGAYHGDVGTVLEVVGPTLYLRFADGSEAVFATWEVRPAQQKLPLVVARTTQPADYLNEWVVEVDGVRRARFVGNNAVFLAARTANEWRNA